MCRPADAAAWASAHEFKRGEILQLGFELAHAARFLLIFLVLALPASLIWPCCLIIYITATRHSQRYSARQRGLALLGRGVSELPRFNASAENLHNFFPVNFSPVQ